MDCIAVIDVETNWENQVISIGAVIAEKETLRTVEDRYYVLDPIYKTGGMYSYALNLKGQKTVICQRDKAIDGIIDVLKKHNVNSLFAYNAHFDYNHLPELQSYTWYDIMRIAAYKQYNRAIPLNAVCCSTGRLKTGYGVEGIMRILKGEGVYFESHNALFDAHDELEVMRLLKVKVDTYIKLF